MLTREERNSPVYPAAITGDAPVTERRHRRFSPLAALHQLMLDVSKSEGPLDLASHHSGPSLFHGNGDAHESMRSKSNGKEKPPSQAT